MSTRVCRYIVRLALIVIGAVSSARAHDILLGVNPHLMSNRGAQEAELPLIRIIGFNAVRDDALWSAVEERKGNYRIPPAWDAYVRDARRSGIEPLIILDYGNKYYDDSGKPTSPASIAGFVRYASFVVKHFQGQVNYFEIWNEWDTHAGGAPSGDAADYARLFDAVFPALKKIDPTAVFLASASAGGNDRWYEQIARLGIVSRADGVAVHPYVYPVKRRSGVIPPADEAERSAQEVVDIEKSMRQFDGGKEVQIYITEIGWTTSRDESGVKVQTAASLAQRAFLLFSSLPYIRGVWWYDFVDDGANAENSQDRFGLVHQNLSYKLTATAIRQIERLIKNNNLTIGPASDLTKGLVELNRNVPGEASIIAWYVGDTGSPNRTRRGWTYVIACDPAQKIERVASGDSTQSVKITAIPTVFSYHRNGCTHKTIRQMNRPMTRMR